MSSYATLTGRSSATKPNQPVADSTSTALPRPAPNRAGRWRINLAAYLFLLPQLSVFLLFVVLPVLFALVLAFLDYRPTRVEWVGLDNFRRVFTDPLMGIALRNTSIFTLGVVIFWLGKALLIAYLLDPLSKGLQTFFKSAFYLPSVTSSVIIRPAERHPEHVRAGKRRLAGQPQHRPGIADWNAGDHGWRFEHSAAVGCTRAHTA